MNRIPSLYPSHRLLDIHQKRDVAFGHLSKIPPQPMKWKWNMAKVQMLGAFGFAALAVFLAIGMEAQARDPATRIQQKLVSQIKLTKSAAGHSDIVTAGDVVVLHKDGLMMCSSAFSCAFSNTCGNGVLAASYNNRAKDAATSFLKGRLPFGGGGSVTDAANSGCASRKLVAGENFWVTGVTPQKDGILVSAFGDPGPDPSGNQVRYCGEIKFHFAKRSLPPPDDFVKTVSEVITMQPPDDKGDQGGQGAQLAEAAATAAAPAPPAAPPASMTAIPPPPPPADAPPPAIAIG